MGIPRQLKQTKRVSRKRKPSFVPLLFKNLFDFIYPPICLLCDSRYDNSGPVCPACHQRLRSALHVKDQSGPGDFTELSGPPSFDRALTCWEFTPELENLIHQVKYQGRKKLGFFLGQIAGQAVAEGRHDPFLDSLLVPVPLHAVRMREREFNQSEWIAKGLASSTSASILPNALERKKNTRTQTALSAGEREKNVKDAFRVRKPEAVRGRNVIMVDDVITTGATLNACAKVLKEAGAESVTGFALARPVKRISRG